MPSTMTLYGETVVVTSTANGTPIFIPMTPWVLGVDVIKARAAWEMRGNSNVCQIAPGYETSNDKITINASTPTSIQTAPVTYATADGFFYHGQFYDISSGTGGTGANQWVRFGMLCQPGSGTAVQGCWASLSVDVQGP